MRFCNLLGLTVSVFSVLAITSQAAEGENHLLASHAQDLVALQGEKLVPFKSDTFFEVPYTILYFGAGWCSDCRRFSPDLVMAYDKQPKGRRDFEVLLLSLDKSQAGMVKYMVGEKMQWPALAFDKLPVSLDISNYHAGRGIPWLSVIDRKGTVLLHSESDKDATNVLAQLQRLIASRDAGGKQGK